jgi:hypothetical protein
MSKGTATMTQQQPNCATPQNPQVNQGNPQASGAESKPEAQRDQRGRFTAGNRGGPGNPFARQTAALRQALVNAVSEKDIADIAAVLLEKARQGDVAASRLVFAYTLGKPAAAANPDTLDQEEMKTLANNHVDYDDLDRVAKLMPVAMMLKLFHVMLPYLDQAKAKQWQDMWQDLGAQMDQQQAEDEAADREEEEAGADMEAGSEPAQRQTLEESVRAWEAEVQELKAKLSPAGNSTAPAKEAVAEESTTHEEYQQRRCPKRQPEEVREAVAAGCPGGSRLPSAIYRPSRNGSNGESAGPASDDRTVDKRL